MTPQEQFAKGQSLYDDKKFEEALPFFRNAFEATLSPNASLYVARCLERLGKLDQAYAEMQKTVTIATEKAAEDKKYASTRDAAAGELAQLTPRVALLVIAFTEDYPEASVTVNERELEVGELGQPFPVMPGEVTIVGKAEGRETVTKRENVDGGETKTVALALPGATGTTQPPPDDGPGFFTPMRFAGVGVAGLGVVGMVVFAITGSSASSKFSEVEELCPAGVCSDDAKAIDLIDSGKTMQTVANVSVVIGGAALIAGTLLIVLGGSDDDVADPPEEGDVSLAPSPGGVGLSVAF